VIAAVAGHVKGNNASQCGDACIGKSMEKKCPQRPVSNMYTREAIDQTSTVKCFKVEG
jgi:hypothetical protein